MVAVGVLSLSLAAKLMLTSFTGWSKVNGAWKAIHEDEQQAAWFGQQPDPLPKPNRITPNPVVSARVAESQNPRQ
jgi:hypothetical protein